MNREQAKRFGKWLREHRLPSGLIGPPAAGTLEGKFYRLIAQSAVYVNYYCRPEYAPVPAAQNAL